MPFLGRTTYGGPFNAYYEALANLGSGAWTTLVLLLVLVLVLLLVLLVLELVLLHLYLILRLLLALTTPLLQSTCATRRGSRTRAWW